MRDREELASTALRMLGEEIGDFLRKLRLNKLIANRFIDLRATAAGLGAIALLTLLIVSLFQAFSFWPTFGILIVAWLVVGVTTLVDD